MWSSVDECREPPSRRSGDPSSAPGDLGPLAWTLGKWRPTEDDPKPERAARKTSTSSNRSRWQPCRRDCNRRLGTCASRSRSATAARRRLDIAVVWSSASVDWRRPLSRLDNAGVRLPMHDRQGRPRRPAEAQPNVEKVELQKPKYDFTFPRGGPSFRSGACFGRFFPLPRGHLWPRLRSFRSSTTKHRSAFRWTIFCGRWAMSCIRSGRPRSFWRRPVWMTRRA